MIMKWWALLSLLPALGGAAEIPEPIFPSGVGVNIHFVTGNEKDLDLIAAAGIKFIRMDFAWTGTERKKGQYDWSGYEQLLSNLEKRDIRPIFILDYSNPLYEGEVGGTNPLTHVAHRTTASPQHPESVAAFAKWAAAATKHFAGHRILWEIWNEPNIQFWSPKPDAQQYTALALATCKAIREVEPSETIIGPASSTFPWEFLETFLKSGVLEYLDGVSVHPYRGLKSPPETAAADYKRLKELIEKYAPGGANGKKVPILDGEWGYSSNTKGVSLETQAAFAARQQLINLLNGVPVSIWYDWKNDGDDPAENEHNFGLVMPDLKPKPAYVAIKTLTRELASYRITRRLPLAGADDYVLLLADSTGNKKLAAWTLAEPHEITFETSARMPRKPLGTKSNGESFTPRTLADRLTLELTAAPQYITLGNVPMR
jgi:hypothetical protein